MPSATARRLYEDQIPSFMSIIDDEPNTFNGRGLAPIDESPRYIQMADSYPECPKHAPPAPPHPSHMSQLGSMGLANSHRLHNIASTPSFESADSSPTTTLATDTSSLSDPSPSSSPDSPVHLLPLNNFPGTSFGGHASGSLTVDSNITRLERPMTSPSPRRGRNMKGLSIQPPFGGNLSTAEVSEPASPVFIKPKIPGMKRKPSQLSLNTDSGGLLLRPVAAGLGAGLDVPSSPALPPILQRRQLKHSTSSPHMLSFAGLKSSTFGPAGGMSFPTMLERGADGLSEAFRPKRPSFDSAIAEEDSPIRSQVASRAALDFQPHDESEQNEDQKSPGYPNGPVAIYDDNVYLYLEPTADEAAKFDVVMNVAREVLNPFNAPQSDKKQEKEASPIESPFPETAMTCDSFTTAFEFPPSAQRGPETPTTPKANSLPEPEYIHMLWDHNTDIAHDLIGLCETIEKRTKEGKKVLVHCQQGASRSASLIIAYGIYQNPTLSVNDAYYAAQAKSKWISPNMRLMYCLQDFQKEIAKRKLPLRSAAGPRSGRSPTKYHRITLSADAVDLKPKEPLTAPLPDEKENSIRAPSPGGTPSHSRGKSTPNIDAISPGPSSAPSTFTWDEKEDVKDPGRLGRFHLEGNSLKPPQVYEPPQRELEPEVHLAPKTLLVPSTQSSSSFFQPPPSPGFAAHRFNLGPQDLGFSGLSVSANSLPLRNHSNMPRFQDFPVAAISRDEDALLSPRAEIMTDNPIHAKFSEVLGMTFVEQPPTPDDGFFSPRQTMFPRDPFKPFGRPTQVADPRSPPTQGETPIVRSIDDVL
ncbi:tyrosine-protein phosphatase MSG5 [Microdochium nivale]|nr:tyrosine-protein phosphatase MSG5 [Microdochium nivale]